MNFLDYWGRRRSIGQKAVIYVWKKNLTYMYQKWSIRFKVASISLGLEDGDEVKV